MGELAGANGNPAIVNCDCTDANCDVTSGVCKLAAGVCEFARSKSVSSLLP